MLERFITRDFYLSAMLLCNSFRLIDSEKRSDGVYFMFENNNDGLLNKLKDDYAHYNAYVNMNKFVKAQARLRKELDKHR